MRHCVRVAGWMLMIACEVGADVTPRAMAQSPGNSPTAPPPTSALPKAASRPDNVVSGERGQQLEEIVKKHGRGVFWGAVVVVEDGHALLEKGYGDAGDGRGAIRPDSWFDTGSLSKQFTAAAVLRLVDQGKLSLDQSIEELLDNVPKDKAAITVRQLLSHTSGLPVEAKADSASGADREKMVARVMKAKLVSTPGEKFQYNNVGYFVLAAIAERVGKKPFEDVLAEEVFVPGGLDAAHTVSMSKSQDPRETARRSSAFKSKPTSASYYAWTWWFKGATGVVASVQDLRRWDEALRDDKVLSDASRRAMFEAGQGGYGCGWFVDHSGTEHARAHHGGSTPGYRTFMIRLLAKNTMVAVLTNEEHDAEGLARALMNAIAPDPMERGVWTRAYLTKFQPDAIGRYHSSKPKHDGKGGPMWMVMERYDGMEFDGRVIRDERTSLVLVDPKAPGQWMMLSRIDDDGTRQLIKELETAIALRKSAGARGDDEGLEAWFETVPYGMKPPEIVDYPSRAKWRVMAEDAAAAKFRINGVVRDSDRRITVYLEDEEAKKTPVVARMDVKTAEKLLCDLKEKGPGERVEQERERAE